MKAAHQQDDTFRVATFMSELEKTGSKDAAALLVKKMYPIYESDIKEFTPEQLGDDSRPLPIELKLRVNDLVMRIGPELMESEIKRYGSMNAVVRSRIKARVG